MIAALFPWAELVMHEAKMGRCHAWESTAHRTDEEADYLNDIGRGTSD
jgi:hypothetical protein